jgi:inorganic pyrophosphatase
MSKRSKRSAGLADPTRLPPFESNDADLTVIIETPKGSRNKYAYDPEERIFALRKVLPAGMAFPYDFGFVPSTLAGDGDPPMRRAMCPARPSR